MSKQPQDPNAEADERNLVEAESSVEVTSEDQFFRFWDAHGLKIVIALALLGVGAVGYSIVSVMARSAEEKVQQAFAAADERAAKITFAEEHPAHSLSGLAYLEVAHEEYEAEEYLQAENHYAAALGVDALEEPFVGRAALGRALSQLKQGKTEDALGSLETIIADASYFDATRAEAAYHAALILMGEGDNEAAREKIAFIEQLPYAQPPEDLSPVEARNWRGPQWVERAESLLTQIPASTGS